MIRLSRLAAVAWDGLDDMLPALKAVWDSQGARDRLRPLWGGRPLVASLVMGGVALIIGSVAARTLGTRVPFGELVHWPAVTLAVLMAALVRRYLFSRDDEPVADFTVLAASLLPGIAVLLVGSALVGHIGGSWSGSVGAAVPALAPLQAVADLLGVAAALAIALASLCYSRAWLSALMDLAVRLVVFRVMVWLTTLVLVELGLVGRLVAALLAGLFNLHLPEWLPPLLDGVSAIGILVLAYLAVIGGTWTACREAYPDLLDNGQADILKPLEALLRPRPDSKGQDSGSASS